MIRPRPGPPVNSWRPRPRLRRPGRWRVVTAYRQPACGASRSAHTRATASELSTTVSARLQSSSLISLRPLRMASNPAVRISRANRWPNVPSGSRPSAATGAGSDAPGRAAPGTSSSAYRGASRRGRVGELHRLIGDVRRAGPGVEEPSRVCPARPPRRTASGRARITGIRRSPRTCTRRA